MTTVKHRQGNHFRHSGIVALALALLLPATAYTHESPVNLITDLSGQMLTRLHDDAQEIRSQPASLLQIIEDSLLPHFDSSTTARLVLADHWGEATPEQRTQFTQEFRDYLARFYARVFIIYAGEKMDAVHAPLDVPGDCAERCVESKIKVTDSNKEIVIRYHLIRSPSSWQVYDFSIDGVSLVVTNRSQFKSLITRDGLPTVIADLAAHNNRPFR